MMVPRRSFGSIACAMAQALMLGGCTVNVTSQNGSGGSTQAGGSGSGGVQNATGSAGARTTLGTGGSAVVNGGAGGSAASDAGNAGRSVVSGTSGTLGTLTGNTGGSLVSGAGGSTGIYAGSAGLSAVTATGGAVIGGGQTSVLLGGASSGGQSASTPSAGRVSGADCGEVSAYLAFTEGQGTTTTDAAKGHVGTLTGNVAWSTGKLGGGVTTDGSSYVSVPDAADLDPGLSDFAVAAWVKIPATACQHSRLITHGTHGQPGHDGYALMEWGGSWGAVPCGGAALLVGSETKSAEWLVGTCSAMNDGLWHHYAGVVNRAGTMDFYVDGVKLESPCTGLSGQAAWGAGGARDITPLINVSLDPTCALCIGASCQNSGTCAAPSEFFNGTIDEVAFWKRALAVSDVAAIYASGAGKAICP
jgi:hypothetical protein